jgi:hypothetical protein
MKIKNIITNRIFKCCICSLALFILGGCAELLSVKNIQSIKGEDAAQQGIYEVNIQIPETRLPDYEKLTYEVRWLGLRAGTFTASVVRMDNYKGRDVYVLEATMKANAFLSKIYRIDDRFVSYMDVEKLHTLRHEVYRRDGNYKKDAITEFDQVNHKAYFKNFIDKSEKVFDIPPGVQDILTACYYFMLLPLRVGDKIGYYVCNNETNYQFLGFIQSKVLLRVPESGKKEYEAFLMQPYAKLKGKKVDKGNLNAYFSCEKRRIPLLAVLRGPIFTQVTVSLTKIENQ